MRWSSFVAWCLTAVFAQLHCTVATAGYRVQVAAPGGGPVSLYVEEHGRGAPLVLIHGLGASGYMWRLVVPRLARTHRVITIDLKGFGRSDKPFDATYSPADQARLVNAFLARRGLRNVTLAGHSLGGVIALLAALDDAASGSRRIARLVTMNAPALPQALSTAVRLLRTPVLPYAALTLAPAEVPTALALFTEGAGMAHVGAAEIEAYAAPLRQPGGAHALITTARQIVPHDPHAVIARYPRLSIPSLIVACRGDQTVPAATAVGLARLLPRARLVMLEGCDHIPPEQTPDQIVRLLSRFR